MKQLITQIAGGLQPDNSAQCLERLMKAAQRPGLNLLKVWFEFAAWLLDDTAEGVIRFVVFDGSPCSPSHRQRIAIQSVADLSAEGCADLLRWRSAGYDASDACNDALNNPPATAATLSASWAAEAIIFHLEGRTDHEPDARMVMNAAEAVGRAVTWTKRADEAARRAAYARQAEKLLELLEAASTAD